MTKSNANVLNVLVQYVHEATHTAGNLLDLVITADSD